MGLETGQGLLLSETFYWNLNYRTRAFTKRFLPKAGDNYPSSLHASCYSGVMHYMRAVAKIGPAQAKASGREAIAAMKEMPTDDDCFGACSVRSDGRFICPVYLFQVKTPPRAKCPGICTTFWRRRPATKRSVHLRGPMSNDAVLISRRRGAGIYSAVSGTFSQAGFSSGERLPSRARAALYCRRNRAMSAAAGCNSWTAPMP